MESLFLMESVITMAVGIMVESVIIRLESVII